MDRRRRRVSFSSDVAVRLEAMRDDFSHEVHDLQVRKQFHPTRFPRLPCSIGTLLDAAEAMKPIVAPLVEVLSDQDVDMVDCTIDLDAPVPCGSFGSWEEIDQERWIDELVCMEALQSCVWVSA
jgi:hypothetical protein